MTNESTVDSVTVSRKLYSVSQITFAAWAASPVAGCLLLNFNYRVFERRRAAWQVLTFGCIATVFTFAFVLSYPHKFPRMTLPLVSAALMWPLVSYLQGEATRNHFGKGGKKGSWWATIGLSLGLVLCMVAVLVTGLMLYQYVHCYYECL
jgi:hypothetical protein